MKKLFLIIIVLFCSIYIAAETSVSVSTSTAVDDNFGVQAVIPGNTVKESSHTINNNFQLANSKDVVNASTGNIEINKSTDTINISTNTVQVNKSTDTIAVSSATVNVSSDTQNIDITKPLKYKEVKADKNIEVSSVTVIPDENDLGTYYSSGAIVEKPQKDSNYDLNLPTTTALGIAGEKVLDKLNLNTSTDTVSTDNVSSSTTTVTPSTFTVTTEDKKETKQEDKKETTEDKNKSFTKKIMDKMPFDSKLQLSGRKLIGINYSGTIYDEEESGKRANSSDFSMEQELQMKIKGSVGDRLELTVDFDDTQEDKKIFIFCIKEKGKNSLEKLHSVILMLNFRVQNFPAIPKNCLVLKLILNIRG